MFNANGIDIMEHRNNIHNIFGMVNVWLALDKKESKHSHYSLSDDLCSHLCVVHICNNCDIVLLCCNIKSSFNKHLISYHARINDRTRSTLRRFMYTHIHTTATTQYLTDYMFPSTNIFFVFFYSPDKCWKSEKFEHCRDWKNTHHNVSFVQIFFSMDKTKHTIIWVWCVQPLWTYYAMGFMLYFNIYVGLESQTDLNKI